MYMAQRGKAISVKIATPKIIKALETALAKLNADYASQEANEAKFEKAKEKWDKEVVKFAMENFSKAVDIRTNYRSWTGKVNIDFDIPVKADGFPAEPERDFESIHSSTYREQKNEMENAIRILKMTDEETVSTSTYQAVARYL